MLNNRKLVIDSLCEVKDLLEPYANEKFYDFNKHTIIPGAVYLIGRTQFAEHSAKLKELAEAGTILPILSNPAEGSDTIRWQAHGLGILPLVEQGKILIITGGYLPENLNSLYYENFLPKILDYEENLQAIEDYKRDWSDTRPYKFLFLNGRARSHRRLLLQRLSHLLPEAIWTNLDHAAGEIRTLESKYEFNFYREQKELPSTGFVKYSLFNDTWGDIYLNAAPYNDTYFSLVTETVFDYPYSFRTEKIWKPIAIGQPWIAVSNAGYYRDMHNLGFKTFGHLIDESFDTIDNNLDRLERIALVVEDLCQQDLAKFSEECYTICKYNQQLLAELGPKVRKEFPQRFFNYINERS